MTRDQPAPLERTQALNLCLRAAEHALHEATPEHWLGRARDFEAARPTVTRTRDAARRYLELTNLATACRNHASIVQPTLEQVEEARFLATQLLDAIDQDLDTVLERLGRATDPDRATYLIDQTRSLVERRTAVILRAAALSTFHPRPPTHDDEPAGALEQQRAQLAALTAPRSRLEAA